MEGRTTTSQEAGGEPRPGAPHKPRRGTRPSGPPSTSRHGLCAGPRRPQVRRRLRPLETRPSHARPPWGQSLQHQDSRVRLHPNPKAALAVSPSHPRPSHLGHLPRGCPRHPWGAPAHMGRAPWPSRQPGSPCPESPSFLSQSGRDSRRPHPRREKSRGQGGAALDLAGHRGWKRLHQADTSTHRRNCRFLPAAQNSRHILQAASPTLPMTKTAPCPTLQDTQPSGSQAFRKAKSP